MKLNYIPKYPSVDDLRKKAKKRIPNFAFEYLDGGCNEDVNIKKNTDDIRKVELVPNYLKPRKEVDMKTELFGHVYDAPFGISPVGLQGLMWPGAPEILAKAAKAANIPFVLSTVTTASIETTMEITEGKAWFQLYHPAKEPVRDSVLNRAQDAGCEVLVLLCDVPVFGWRPRDIRFGLAMPPRMTLNNIIQIMTHPNWALSTLFHGQPAFETMKQYMPKNLNMKQLGKFMNDTFNGVLNEEKIKPIRDIWKGKIVLKGVSSKADMDMSVKLGLDGVILSNHGGRQLDAAQSSIATLKEFAPLYKDKIKIMMDSGLRGGPDIARTLAEGADFTFMGRAFMYGAAALGKKGGDHTINILKTQLWQVMNQIGCDKVADLPQYLKK
ncbi:alpha-hydroxy acid oxidase [Arachidicoccus soli]|uniref:Alpha-hydroxy-acid oxidizing protein n=1 Tax=Arachidicoccus soli TaxID=2341117 RepID=A0A386HPJ4_9BACT|nr:alpha-hydroxy acid oxidase [Arachidicoccus soli]AYD47204.1 alpha-hydroxy-acid oxidizing protein [Arachidicoccus soli]